MADSTRIGDDFAPKSTDIGLPTNSLALKPSKSSMGPSIDKNTCGARPSTTKKTIPINLY
jgi:hypothetical protein